MVAKFGGVSVISMIVLIEVATFVTFCKNDNKFETEGNKKAINSEICF